MTIAHDNTTATAQPTAQEPVAGASPVDLDLRRRLAQARRELAETRAALAEARHELDARRDQEASLRAHLEELAAASTVCEHRRVELHVCYLQMLTQARAAAAAAARGEAAPIAYIAGHLDEIGLAPEPGAVPDQLVAEGLALANGLVTGRTGGAA